MANTWPRVTVILATALPMSHEKVKAALYSIQAQDYPVELTDLNLCLATEDPKQLNDILRYGVKSALTDWVIFNEMVEWDPDHLTTTVMMETSQEYKGERSLFLKDTWLKVLS